MARKPSNIIYSVSERPPLITLVILAFQHAVLALLFVVYPIVAAAEAGLSFDDTQVLITGCIIFMGITTMIQCWPRTGSGILLIQQPNPMHLPLLVQSFGLGGLAAYAGTSLIAAFSQLVLTRFMSALRTVFPPEVCGVAVTMMGVALAAPALRRAFNLLEHDALSLDWHYPVVSFVTLAVIVGLAIFSRGTLRLFAVAIGAGLGWVLAEWADLAPSHGGLVLSSLPLVDLPNLRWPGLSFSWVVVPVAIITAVVSAIDMLGSVVSMQRIDDADWRRVDMPAASRAIRTNGIGDIGAALTGGFATASSSASIGIAFATGATAWRVGVAAGLMMVLAAFSPRLVALLTFIPSSVIGAILLYTAAFLIVAGMDLILSRRMSDRRIFTVGLSVIAGLAVAVLPQLVDMLPGWMHPIFESPLSVATAFAVLLNLVFRIGIRQEASVPMKAGDNAFETATEFLERQGDIWGARRDVIAAAIPLAAEAAELLLDNEIAEDGLEMRAHFDEMNFDVSFVYRGAPVEIPSVRPSPEDLLGDAKAVARFVGYMLSKRADRLVIGQLGDRQLLTLRFEH
jgi:xanthine permease XanP